MKKHNRGLTVKTVCIATALLAAAALLGCGEKEESVKPRAIERIDLVLDYFPNADHVGIYAALADGDFRKAGLDVKPQTPSDPAAPLKLLAAGRADVAISYQPELLLARERGLKLVSIGAIVQKPLTSIISLEKKKISTPKDLAGKKIGTAGIPYQSAYLKTILQKAGVSSDSIEQIDVGFNLTPAMLTGKVDATLGSFWNYEGVELKQRGKNPRIIRMEEAGVPTYNELIVVARQQDLATQGGKFRRLMRAMAEGYKAAKQNPEKAVSALTKANPDLKRKLQLASVKATLPVFFPQDSDKPFGYQSPAAWVRYGDWMYRNGILKERPKAGIALTNEFLPGQGL